MDTMETIRERRSIRQYEDRPVEDEKLQQVMEAARLAPSAGNRQEWKFVVVRDPELRSQLVGAARDQQFVAEAPVCIAACAQAHGYVMSCGYASHTIDLAIALDHIQLAARALGLGTCWLGAFEQDKVRHVLGIPATIEVVGLMPLGYPAEWPGPRDRRSYDDVVSFDTWQD